MSGRILGTIVATSVALVALLSASAPASAISDNQKLTVTTSSTSTDVTVTWTPINRANVPSDIGVGYSVSAIQPGVPKPAAYCLSDGSAVTGTSCVLRGLTPGVTYDVQVLGCSLFDGRLHPGTPGTIQGPGCHGAMNTLGSGSVGYVTLCCQGPSAPQSVEATDVSGGALSVTWAAPSFLGGATSVDYVVTTDPPSTGCTTTALTCTVEGLPFSTPFTATVAARNPGGQSPGVSAAPVTLVPPSPGQPYRITGKVQGTSKIAVSWKAPLDAKKLAVSSYRVTTSPGGRTCTAQATRCTVTGLKRGVPYTFTVQAFRGTSASGKSRASAKVTIPLPPPPPTPTSTPVPAPTSAPEPTKAPSPVF